MSDSSSILSLLDNVVAAVEVGFSYDGIVSVPETGLEDAGQQPGLAGWVKRRLKAIRKVLGLSPRPDIPPYQSPQDPPPQGPPPQDPPPQDPPPQDPPPQGPAPQHPPSGLPRLNRKGNQTRSDAPGDIALDDITHGKNVKESREERLPENAPEGPAPPDPPLEGLTHLVPAPQGPLPQDPAPQDPPPRYPSSQLPRLNRRGNQTRSDAPGDIALESITHGRNIDESPEEGLSESATQDPSTGSAT